MTVSKVQTLIFDTFGTLVDWRTSIVEDLSRWGAKNGVVLDWAAFADAVSYTHLTLPTICSV